MTLPLFGEDAYLKEAPAKIIALSGENGVILDRSIYYPTGGGQPGDTGSIVVNSDTFSVEETIKGEDGNIILLLADGLSLLNIGDSVTQFLNWDMRYAHMKVHTALHLLSVVIPLPVTGGAITALKLSLIHI